jgi:hypothetical protein
MTGRQSAFQFVVKLSPVIYVSLYVNYWIHLT